MDVDSLVVVTGGRTGALSEGGCSVLGADCVWEGTVEEGAPFVPFSVTPFREGLDFVSFSGPSEKFFFWLLDAKHMGKVQEREGRLWWKKAVHLALLIFME